MRGMTASYFPMVFVSPTDEAERLELRPFASAIASPARLGTFTSLRDLRRDVQLHRRILRDDFARLGNLVQHR